MMDNTVAAIVFIIFLWQGYILLKQYRDKRRYPFQWSCPTCDFTVKSNSEYAINVVRMGHKH